MKRLRGVFAETLWDLSQGWTRSCEGEVAAMTVQRNLLMWGKQPKAQSLWLVPAATALQKLNHIQTHPHPDTRLRGYQHFHHWHQGGKGDTEISAKEERTNAKLLLPLILQKSTLVVAECVYTSSWQYICFSLKNLDFCAAVDCCRHESSYKIVTVWFMLRRSLIYMEQRGDVLPHFHTKGKSFHSPSPAQAMEPWFLATTPAVPAAELLLEATQKRTPPKYLVLLFLFSVLSKE